MAMFPAILMIYSLILICSGNDTKADVKCELAAFLENPDGSDPFLIDSGRAIAPELKSCENDAEKCAKIVEEQATHGTDKGNLTLLVDSQNGYTVGDVLCDKADAVKENVQNKIVHIYWRLCHSQWKPTSFRMPQPLCCEDVGRLAGLGGTVAAYDARAPRFESWEVNAWMWTGMAQPQIMFSWLD